MGWADFLTDIDWGGVIKKAVPAAIGTYMVGNANEKAARAAVDANAQAAQQLTQGSDRSAQALIDASRAGQARLATVADRTAPAVDYLRSVMAEGNTLTPGQKQRVLDVRRDTGTLLSNRLGGRSATAIATRAAQDVENSIYGANRARADNAAGTMAGQNVSAVNAAANQDISLGNNLAQVYGNQGSNLSRITSDTGSTVANAGLATAKTQAEMVGDAFSPMSALRSIIAEDRKGGASERDVNSYTMGGRR